MHNASNSIRRLNAPQLCSRHSKKGTPLCVKCVSKKRRVNNSEHYLKMIKRDKKLSIDSVFIYDAERKLSLIVIRDVGRNRDEKSKENYLKVKKTENP